VYICTFSIYFLTTTWVPILVYCWIVNKYICIVYISCQLQGYSYSYIVEMYTCTYVQRYKACFHFQPQKYNFCPKKKFLLQTNSPLLAWCSFSYIFYYQIFNCKIFKRYILWALEWIGSYSNQSINGCRLLSPAFPIVITHATDTSPDHDM